MIKNFTKILNRQKKSLIKLNERDLYRRHKHTYRTVEQRINVESTLFSLEYELNSDSPCVEIEIKHIHALNVCEGEPSRTVHEIFGQFHVVS